MRQRDKETEKQKDRKRERRERERGGEIFKVFFTSLFWFVYPIERFSLYPDYLFDKILTRWGGG